MVNLARISQRFWTKRGFDRVKTGRDGSSRPIQRAEKANRTSAPRVCYVARPLLLNPCALPSKNDSGFESQDQKLANKTTNKSRTEYCPYWKPHRQA